MAERDVRGIDTFERRRQICGFRKFWPHEVVGGETKEIVLSVKAGHTGPNHVSELRGILEREKAIIGVLITMQEPTRAMVREAASAGSYKSRWGQHPRLQILTVRELLDGRQIDSPPVRQTSITYRRAPRAPRRVAEQPPLEGPDLARPRMARAQLRQPRKGAGQRLAEDPDLGRSADEGRDGESP